MKAIVVRQYGGPEVLKFEDYPDPVPGAQQLPSAGCRRERESPRLQTTCRLERRSFYPIKFPGLIGVDMAGTVVKMGPGVEGFSAGDQVFAMADNTYAELCVVKAAILRKFPRGSI